eukprot:5036013-Pyramimonas_sp.AAC.1
MSVSSPTHRGRGRGGGGVDGGALKAEAEVGPLQLARGGVGHPAQPERSGGALQPSGGGGGEGGGLLPGAEERAQQAEGGVQAPCAPHGGNPPVGRGMAPPRGGHHAAVPAAHARRQT